MASPGTDTTAPSGRNGDGQLVSAAQRDRRERMLDAALALAARGGFDAVQMRVVAEQAGVALGTLYRYFPSKIHLLVSALARELGRTEEYLSGVRIPGAAPGERTLFVLARMTRGMQRSPMLTEAITRAFMFADPSAAGEVSAVASLMERMLTRAMREGEPTPDEAAIARIIGDVWLSNLVAWVTRRASADEVAERLELAVGLLLARGDDPPEPPDARPIANRSYRARGTG